MKKMLLTGLAFLLAGLTVAGCGPKKRDPNVILIGIPESASVEDYETNELTLWLEEQTGLDLQFEKFATAAADYRSQLATRVANNEELPDMLMNFTLTEELTTQYGKTGVLMDLKPYFDDKEKSKNFWDGLSKMDETFQKEVLRKMTDSDTGAIYTAPRIEYALIDPMDYQLYINQKWLDKLGLKAPTNLDELHDVLVAFRDQDPNGNGQKDEIPLIGRDAVYGDAVNWLVNFFTYCDDTRWFNADDNQKLYLPFDTDEYREGLKLVAQYIEEGLLSDLFFTVKNSELKALLNPEDGVETVGLVSGHSSLIWKDQSEQMEDYVPLNLIGRAVYDAQSFTRKSFITTSCQYPENAFKVLMALYSDEGWKRAYYGVKGRDWDDADAGQISYMGLPADIKDINHIWGNITTQNWGSVVSFAFYSEGETSQFTDDNAWLTKRYSYVKEMYENYKAAAEKNNPKYIVQTLIYSTEEKEKTAEIRENVQAYIKDSRAQFCSGELDINDDKVWDEYVKKLDELGAKTWTEQAQRLYDEQQKQ